MTTLDLSHTIEHGMITYRGLPAPLICDYLSREASRQFYAEGTEFHIERIDLVANTGSYLDSPFHRREKGSCKVTEKRVTQHFQTFTNTPSQLIRPSIRSGYNEQPPG
jgi:kynurenine formamidase